MTPVLKPMLFGLFSAGLISACSHMATGPESANTAPKETEKKVTLASEKPAPENQKIDLTGESLFQLLLAEMSVNRRDYATAAVLYGEVGENYNSVDALARAAALNQTIGQFDAMHRQALQWHSLRPNDERALQAVILSSAVTGDVQLAIDNLTYWLNMNHQADTSILAPAVDRMDESERAELTKALDDLQPKYPKSASLYYTRSRLYYAAEDVNKAAELAQKSINLDKNLPASLLYFQVLQDQEKPEEAKKVIKSLLNTHPDNIQVAIQYTRYIYRYEPDNLAELEVMHNQFGRDPVIARTYARAAFDQHVYDAAQAVYQHLLELGYDNESHYYLGRIDLINEMNESAANHFDAVQQPPYLASALAEWVSMARAEDEARLIEKLDQSKSFFPASATIFWRLQSSYYHLLDQPEKAWTTLENALDSYPDNTYLLYEQAMLAASLNRFSVMETNLSEILELEPDNINAMNALGYTWVDLDKNLPQANDYIEKALTAEPSNPAFQDSKGWYLYRVGKLEEALDWLQKAYAQMKNDEVAAHIAEVLWSLDRQEEAKNYLNDIHQLNPTSKYLDYLNDLFDQ